MAKLGLKEFKSRWLKEFGIALAGRPNADFLRRGLSHRLQEKAYGGLSTASRRALKRLGEQIVDGTVPVALTAPRIKAGTRLIRAWRGETHEVTVLEPGFAYQGRRYASLSEIARKITGTRWSGPRFFGLKTAADAKSRVSHA